MRSRTGTYGSAVALKGLETGIAGEIGSLLAGFGAELDLSRFLPSFLGSSFALGEFARVAAEVGITGWAGDLLAPGGPSDDKTAGARLLLADPERSAGDCLDEVLTGFAEALEAAAVAADLGKVLGGVLLLPGGSLRPSGVEVLLELGFAASPKISLRPDCWEAGLEDMRFEFEFTVKITWL